MITSPRGFACFVFVLLNWTVLSNAFSLRTSSSEFGLGDIIGKKRDSVKSTSAVGSIGNGSGRSGGGGVGAPLAKGFRRTRSSRRRLSRGGKRRLSFSRESTRSSGMSRCVSKASINNGADGTVISESDLTKKKFVIIAQAQLNGDQHPSVPSIVVDVRRDIVDCGHLDWLFRPECRHSKPLTNHVINSFHSIQNHGISFVHYFELPAGWRNPKLLLPACNGCEKSRTVALSPAQKNSHLCFSAEFQKKSRKYVCFPRHVKKKTCSPTCTRICRQRSFLFIKGKKRCRTKCHSKCTYKWVKERSCKHVTTFKKCAPTHMVIRLAEFKDGIPQHSPYILPTSNQPFSGYKSCSDAEAVNLFKKE